MLDKVKDFLFKQATGRVLVRLTASLAAYLASGQLGLAVSIDPAELNALLQAGVHALITKLKPRPKA